MFRHLKAASASALVLTGSLFALGASAELPLRTPAAEKPDLESFLSQAGARHGMMQPHAITSPTALDQPAKPMSQADSDAVSQIVALMSGGSPALESSGVTRGLAMGANLPAVPALNDLDHATAQAVVAAFSKPGGNNLTTAEQQAQVAATATRDPVFEERVALIRTLYRVDGTDQLVRHFVGTVHMRLIITEVNNHIEIAKLSESDKYRLSAIAAAAQTELEEKVLNMNARQQAANMTNPEIMLLITAYDTEAQRKLTGQRLSDSGKLDRALDLDVRMAQYQIVKKYEAE